LEACAILAKRGRNFRCVMVGEGPSRGKLEEKRNCLGLRELVEMPGMADQGQVLRWWQQAAVGLLTSDNEGMPVSLMEAATCGVPIVATNVGGIPELIQDGTTGLLVSQGDAEGLANALERLLQDSGLGKRLRTA